MTELFIEGRPVDLAENFSPLLTLAIDDVQDFGARNTTYSKTIVLPGTANNNKLFGHIFEVQGSLPYTQALPNALSNFNAAKSASAMLFQDNLQVFKGTARLLEVIMEGDRKEYEIALFGELGGLVAALSNNKLEDLDFSAYNHSYSLANITASWDNAAAGQGYYYPLIDYGNYSTNKHDWDYRTLRPALFVKEYISKMVAAAGYRYDAPLFNTPRFQSLIVPYNQAKLRGTSPVLTNVVIPATASLLTPPTNNASVPFTSASGVHFALNGSTVLEYMGLSPVPGDINITLNGSYTADAPVHIRLMSNLTVLQEYYLPAAAGATPFGLLFSVNGHTFNTGDWIYINIQTTAAAYTVSIAATSTFRISAIGGQNAEITLFNPVTMGAVIPKNILQKDFLSSVVKLFNLYVYEDRSEEKKLKITPYVDFYQTDPDTFVDWSQKMDRGEPVRIKPMSELNARYYEFRFKEDSDYYNDLYKKRYNQTYGSRTYDTDFDFAKESQSVDVIFSGSPLVGYPGEDKVYSTIMKRTGTTTITEENMDSNIRILQAKKITGVSSWSIINGGVVLGSYTDYPYAGHLDDPDAPVNDIQFGTPKELFFVLATGSLNVNQFNVYHSAHMAELTDKDSRLLTATFRLTPQDIYDLDFSRLVWIDGVLWRISKIQDYNTASEDKCKVELLKVVETFY